MKKIANAVLVLQIILWAVALIGGLAEMFAFDGSEMENLDYALTMGMYGTFACFSAAGLLNAIILFFSFRAVSKAAGSKHKKKKVFALCTALAATVLFYSCIVLLFTVRSDAVLFFFQAAIPAWSLCELCCVVMLAVSKERKRRCDEGPEKI